MLNKQLQSDEVDSLFKLILRILLSLGTLTLLVLSIYIVPVEIMCASQAYMHSMYFGFVLILIEMLIKFASIIINITIAIEYQSMYGKSLIMRIVGYSLNGLLLILVSVATLVVGTQINKTNPDFIAIVKNFSFVNLGLVLMNSFVAIGMLLIYEMPQMTYKAIRLSA